ncbi:transglutaminase family protein [Roseomonas sp. JC162]|uniref:Transglutaminase family protein n=1 Tax=Neoroseomonas marina TaxID=1232220 RepID=A0A848EEB6_9PROT|nr:transglutaminase family protein [Neoroseomonas marina]NMJ41837.1 transglutaminase family protein [Neoroseomonas marina]
MARIRIRHLTRYDYRAPVGLTQHRLMVRPRDSHDLRLHEATLAVSPTPRVIRWAHDVFGNSVCLLDWEPESRTDHLEIVSELDLTHYPAGAELPRATVDPTVEFFPFSYAAEEAPDLARLRERHLPDPQRRVDAWARRFMAQGGATRTLPMLEAMTRAIRDEFTYEARDSEGTNSPVATLESGRGACRDFTLLMMEAARSLGLAARFVSGYLYDSKGVGVVGGGATHAWCAIYVPGAGWVEYDPTNGLVAGENLVRVGATRTPEQAVPVGGGFFGKAEDFARLHVDVSVMVGANDEPLPPFEPPAPLPPLPAAETAVAATVEDAPKDEPAGA